MGIFRESRRLGRQTWIEALCANRDAEAGRTAGKGKNCAKTVDGRVIKKKKDILKGRSARGEKKWDHV